MLTQLIHLLINKIIFFHFPYKNRASILPNSETREYMIRMYLFFMLWIVLINGLEWRRCNTFISDSGDLEFKLFTEKHWKFSQLSLKRSTWTRANIPTHVVVRYAAALWPFLSPSARENFQINYIIDFHFSKGADTKKNRKRK